jgi:protein-disulfide isomerase
MNTTSHLNAEKALKIQRVLACAIVSILLSSVSARAQFLGTGPRDRFHDTSILRPPAGAKVAILVFEDLGCPACARAHPYELDAAKQTHVQLVRRDFPLTAHIWTFQGAVLARYIQEKISPQLADQFRTDVFASQGLISSKDDLYQFTSAWLQRHGRKMPSVVDPDGMLAKEVNADLDLGNRLNVGFTPTVVVVTRNAYQVVCGTADGANEPAQILPVVKAALATLR